MTENTGRILLAPRLGPWPPQSPVEAPGPRFYLSWPGWEDCLAKRLGLKPDPAGPAPLMLPADPEDLTLAALDQLADRAGRQGANLWPLLLPPAEGPSALAAAIRCPTAPPAPRPLLSDRAYLAFWTLTEYQAATGAEQLAAAARKEQAMWAALKGEEAAPPSLPASRPEEPDRRAAYAWRCWHRLAAPLIRPDDFIIPTVPEVF
jgi:hypothetical protein